MWQCNSQYRPNITKNYTINTLLANNMKENPEENNTQAVEKSFYIYLKILILTIYYAVFVDNHSNKVYRVINKTSKV